MPDRPGTVVDQAQARPAHDPASLRVEPFTSLQSAKDEWTELAETEGQNVFATWEWNSIWWRHFGQGRALLACSARAEDGRLVAILPLYLWSRRPLRVIRFLGHGPGNQLGPVCADADRAAVASALRGALAALRHDVFFGEELPAPEGWSALLGARVHRRTGDPVIRFEAESWDAFLASRSANFRQQLRRRERRLGRDHDVRFRLAQDPDRLREDLDILFALHRARWGSQTSSFAAREAFHREFSARALARGWLRLWFLELDGEPVAAWHGFRFRGVESYYQAGRDPAMTDTSVGFVLLGHTIREALADGVGTYRLGRGATPFKARFATDDPGLETIVRSPTRVGQVSVAAGTAARSFRPLKTALKKPFDL